MQNSSSGNHIKAALISLIAAGSIAIIPFLLPHRGLATAFYSEWSAFVLGIAACFPFLYKHFWLPFEVPRSAIWLFAFVALIALQPLFVSHAYVADALLPGIYITWAVVLIVLSAWIRKQLGLERALAVLAWTLLIGGTLNAMVGVVQYFDVSGELTSAVDLKPGSVYGNIGQRNHFATQITLASFALIYLHTTHRIKRTPAIMLLALFALVLTASSSRAAVVYIVAGFLLSLISYRAAKTRAHRHLLQGTGLLLTLFLLFQYLLPFLNDWLKLLLGAMGFDVSGLNTLIMLQRSAADGIDVRLSEWRKAWLMFLESPLWGVGIGNYGWYSFNYQTFPEFAAISEGRLFHHSHNLIMQVLAELGIAGVLLLVFMAMTWFRQILSHWKNPSHWLILVLMVVLLLHSNVEYPLWYSYFLGIAAVLFGLGDEAVVKIDFTPGLGQFTTGATLAISGAILLITLRGVQDLNRAPLLAITKTPQEASATLRAVSKNPLLTPWAEVAVVLYGIPDKRIAEEQLLLATRVVKYRPNPHNVNRQIIYLALAGRSVEASVLMNKTYIVYPAEFPKYACSWKSAPVEDVRLLWTEAEKITKGSIRCGTGAESSAGSS